MEEIFNRYIAMQDRHTDTLENNISLLEKGAGGISDLDYLTSQRNLLYKEIKNYFENDFPNEDFDNAGTRSRLTELSDKLGFIMEREGNLKKLVMKNTRLLSLKLGRIRNGKDALNAYNKAAGTV
jgi:hypothetical protein